MKTLFIILATLVIAINSNATDIKSKKSNTTFISGKVTDINTGEALVGVKIQISGNDNIVYTDFDGNFKLDVSDAGNYNLKVSYISYKEDTLTDIKIGTDSENKLSVKLAPKK
ncbi:MAG: hypothetical protein A2X08_04865 [Bacteroidetes bacterium GWA2_32_17]|nr:MAG: hypothetical protein A2X08_04865 [Bacteroidetes bacterium GWA2_32_17]